MDGWMEEWKRGEERGRKEIIIIREKGYKWGTDNGSNPMGE